VSRPPPARAGPAALGLEAGHCPGSRRHEDGPVVGPNFGATFGLCPLDGCADFGGRGVTRKHLHVPRPDLDVHGSFLVRAVRLVNGNPCTGASGLKTGGTFFVTRSPVYLAPRPAVRWAKLRERRGVDPT
jgi:hypothetical protein